MRMLLKEALYYRQEESKVRCLLCPHECLIPEGGTGICRVRRNEKGKLYTGIYGKLSAIHIDPIEKKPLYHYYPGAQILSVGTVGCNMRCQCCQNWHISQSSPDDCFLQQYTVNDIVNTAKSTSRNIGVAYTYNEPGIWIEYVLDVARQIHLAGLKNVMVSNGFISPEPLDELFTCIDAFNIDLKAFSDKFYRSVAGARLEPVLTTLKKIRSSGKHLEITNLVIPTLNDNDEEFLAMVKWISDELGSETVLHLSRYYPTYKMEHNPTSPTTLQRLAEIAGNHLLYVYVGNIAIRDYQDTRCANCGITVIKRSGYNTEIKAIDKNGACTSCHTKIIVV
ncbi:MAG: AmmeMemoRadiSam system radical SAM enzyme [Bacteroidales bacterium]|nr:AmmeMemoRadiSam system radical SAM enzyme [Bacteroidales bacterium]